MVKGVGVESMQAKVFPFSSINSPLDQTILRHWKRTTLREERKSPSLQNESICQEPRARKVQVLVPHEETAQGQKDSRRNSFSPRSKHPRLIITLASSSKSTQPSSRPTASF